MKISDFISAFEKLAIFIFLCSFCIGIHSIDLSYNILKISYEQKIDLYNQYVDMTLSGNTISYFDMYLFGLKLIFYSSVFLVFILFTKYYFQHIEKENEQYAEKP